MNPVKILSLVFSVALCGSASSGASVNSVVRLFLDMGGVAGQTGLGYLSRAVSIPAAWVLGGAVLFLGYPLYRRVEREENLVISDR